MVQRSKLPIEGLPPQGIRFLDLIRDAIDDGKTKREIQEIIKDEREEQGEARKGIRDTDLSKVRRFLKGDDILPPSDTRFINKRKSVDVTRPRESVGITTRKFSYTVAIIDVSNGEIVGGVQVVSDVQLSRDDVIEQAEASIEDAGIELYVDELPDEFQLVVSEAIQNEGETLL